MFRTTVLLPEGLKEKAQRVARRRGISLAELIRRRLEDVVAEEGEARQDAVFSQFVPFEEHADVPENLAVDHDDFLYGDS